jgi:hypothetical protein
MSGDINLPAVINAAQSVTFIAREHERYTAMGTGLGHQTYPAFAVSPGHESLAHQIDANRAFAG